ncbi:hypothetical protein DERF_013807 [Dermatophagoides farinae]|uniref:Uncharacterized protein n=1 Tax=Dermatophagoides farinae TaxID=6954 RepID=A0A922L0X9_DERFA|nr:hypothetical protein DERF_013807 [Dermatophagoides farinae]
MPRFIHDHVDGQSRINRHKADDDDEPFKSNSYYSDDDSKILTRIVCQIKANFLSSTTHRRLVVVWETLDQC